MTPTTEVTVSDAVALLGRTPPTLRELLATLPDAWLDATEGENTFSPRDVVGHLIHAERTDWIPRVRFLLANGETQPFPPFDRFGFRDAIAGRSIASLLDELQSLRTSNLEVLPSLNLTPSDLARRGLHPELGTVTLGQLIATWVAHDLDHLGQVARVLSKRYSSAVGPWKAYLRILSWATETKA